MIGKLFLFFAMPLLCTILIEGLLAFFTHRRKYLILLVLVNCLTNPWVVLFASLLLSRHRHGLLFLFELVVWFLEGFLYAKAGMRKPYRFAIGANGCSYLASFLPLLVIRLS